MLQPVFGPPATTPSPLPGLACGSLTLPPHGEAGSTCPYLTSKENLGRVRLLCASAWRGPPSLPLRAYRLEPVFVSQPPESGGAGEIREGGGHGILTSIKDTETVPAWGTEAPGTAYHVSPTFLGPGCLVSAGPTGGWINDACLEKAPPTLGGGSVS